MLGFLHTNMAELPDDLDLKWPRRAVIHLDTCQLAQVPDVLLRQDPSILILAGNPITSVRKEVFELPALQFLQLGYTNISSLPLDVTAPSRSLTSMNLDGTSISAFPAWMDSWLAFPGDVLYTKRLSVAGSTYCADRDKIVAGALDAFTAAEASSSSQGTGSRLMDASPANWAFLARTVSCAPSSMYRYPLALEDMMNTIQ